MSEEQIKIDFPATPEIRAYLQTLSDRALREYRIAGKAKAKGRIDLKLEPETKPVKNLAERTEEIIGPKGVSERYTKLYHEFNGDRMKVIFKIAEEILDKSLGNIEDPERRVEQAVRTGLVLLTEGVVVAPLDGVPRVCISTNPDKSRYVDIYFAGPIRAAGGSATVLPLILADYARKLLGLDKYKPTEDEVERYVEEVMLYQTEVVSRQQFIPPEELRIIAKNCPVCINGEPTEEKEVSAYRDLPRVSTNRIRGGMGLVITEGVALKAAKILSWSQKVGLDWSWLEKIIKVKKTDSQGSQETKLAASSRYIGRMAAGRPIFCYPSRPGGFRLRYGRARNTSAMGKGVHPATMYITDEFIAVGTQIKIERPGKAAQLFPCTTIEGPTVLLKNGEVKKVKTIEEANECRPKINRILFLGDILVSYGDFRKSAHPLVPAGYCEEWWARELEKKAGRIKAVESPQEVGIEEAIELSKKYSIPLNPKHLHYYSLLSPEEAIELVRFGRKARKEEKSGKTVKLFFGREAKPLLEKIYLPHKVEGEELIVGEEYSQALAFTLALNDSGKKLESTGEKACEILSKLCGAEIRDKAGTFVGTRMGRPEAARPRKMQGNPHGLFPIGLAGGSTRSIDKACMSKKKVEVEIALYKCPNCGEESCFPKCGKCGERTIAVRVCTKCGRIQQKENCDKCGSVTQPYTKRDIGLEKLVEDTVKRLGVKMPQPLKGVKGTFNKGKIAEPLEKVVLRAKHGLSVFRDGTVRYEVLNAPLTHFKPSEIGLSVEKARELGYTRDKDGKDLESIEQVIEMFPQDQVLHEGAGEEMVKIAKFVDEELVKIYEEKPFYNVKEPKDLVGQLVLGLAPHTSAGVVGRIIGFSKARVGWFHPYYIMNKRRNCDGDQDSCLLLMDALLNFSKSYLSDTRGGRMDAPLVFTVALNPEEIDDEIHDAETCREYPLELYEAGQRLEAPSIKEVPIIKHKLGKEDQYIGFDYTHETDCFDLGPKRSMYVQLETMQEKINSQARLQTKIDAVDTKDSLERVLNSHFFPDLIGNTRTFSRQKFRCTKCNESYRRIPLKGLCLKCGHELSLTISKGSVKKYLEIAKNLIHEYDLSDYLKQRILIIEKEIDSVFHEPEKKQKSLFEYV